jgi:predicted N-acetyltransferase YhbS
MEYRIRNEIIGDYRLVENITRKAFWNIHMPGCDEHYLVNVMRHHRDFIPELDLVIEVQDKVIGNIMYTKATLVDEEGNEQPALTFGPVSILPEFQRKGYGNRLISYSFDVAQKLGHEIIVIFGNPSNYVGLGFVSCKKLNISYGDDIYPTAMLAKELNANALDITKKWVYHESEVYNIDKEKADIFDREFDPMQKEKKPSQEEFYILCNSRVITSCI